LGISRDDGINSRKKIYKYLARLDVVNTMYQFESAICKWQKIVNSVNASRHSLLPKNSVVYKNKWGASYGNFKHIFDYMVLAKNSTRY
jgi:hypothetical protein